MKVISMTHQASALSENLIAENNRTFGSNVVRFFSEEEEKHVQKEMRLIFFSKGNIFLESEEAKFRLRTNEGMDLSELDCFGQLITVNFKRLIKECTHFRYIGSPVSFTLTFFNRENASLGTLISDSIFKDIGFGKGDGEWILKD